jgi:uncharacterized membrane protein YbhN (UPF0104 family)
MRHLKIALRVFISLGMSALFVWLSLRKADLHAVLAAMGAADPRRLAAYVGLLLVIHVVRTLRWGILLEPLGKVSFKRLNSASAVVMPVSPRMAGRASGILESFIGAVHLGSGLNLVWFFVLTVVYWYLTAWGLGIVATAFGFDRLTPLMLAVILTIQVVGVMVPAGPGMIGTMQFFTQAGLSLFVTDAFSAHGAAYANTVWLLQFCEQVGLGALFLLAGHVSLKGLFGPRALDEEAAPAAP